MRALFVICISALLMGSGAYAARTEAVGLSSMAPSLLAPPLLAPSLADFIKDAEIGDVRLSPSGQKMLIIRLGPDGRYLGELRDTQDLAKGGVSFDAAPAEIRGARWLSDTRILGQLRERRLRGKKSQWFEFSAIFDERGALKFKLPSDQAQVLGQGRIGSDTLFLAYDTDGDGSSDVSKYNIQTGRSERILRGSDRRFGFMVDQRGEVRISSTFNPNTFELTFHGRDKNGAEWQPIHVFSLKARETWTPLGFYTDNPDELVVLANNGRDTAGIHIFSMSKKAIVRTVTQRDDVDMIDVLVSRDNKILGGRYNTDITYTDWFDPSQKALAETLSGLMPGKSFSITEPTLLGTRIIRATNATDPGTYYYQRPDGKIMPLGSSEPQFEGKALSPRKLITLKARDGLPIPVYITRPIMNTSGALPLVVMPHGGPWARDYGGFDAWAQVLAAQGYLVAQPQFRGTSGFGLALNKAGDGQWGQAMQDDLDDTAKSLIKSGEADPKRIAMFGWSYGGYAALTAGYRGNGLYRCTIAGAAVSDLNRISALLSDNPVANLIQKPTIKGPSPVNELRNATIPVFIIHGDEDQIVDVEHGRIAAKALKEAGKRYEYIEVKGMDHTSDRFTPAHRKALYEALTSWLKTDCGLGPKL
jgi:acetyl esterase/lipase